MASRKAARRKAHSSPSAANCGRPAVRRATPRSRTYCRSPTCSLGLPTHWSRSRPMARSFRSWRSPPGISPQARRAPASTQAHRERGKAAKARTPAARRRSVRAIIRKALEETLDCHPAFEPRQTHPGAHVDAGTEGEMARRVARGIEAVGIAENIGVAIGRSDANGNQRAFGHEDAAERGVLGGDPVAKLV